MAKNVVRIDETFQLWVKEHLMQPHNLSMRTSTGFLAKRLKGQSIIEVKDKNGKPKRLKFKSSNAIDVADVFDEIRF